MPFMAWLAVSEVGVAGWVLAVVQVDVLGAIAAAVGTVVDDDVAVAVSGSGCERRGWGLGWGGVGWSGSWCLHSRGVGGSFEAEGQVVVVVVDVVGVVDGTDGAIDNGDVAGDGGGDRVAVGSSRGAVCIEASAVEEVVVSVLEYVVSRVVGCVCASSLSRFVSRFSRLANLPRSSPSLSPFSYPSRLASSGALVCSCSRPANLYCARS
jgi:hypothetical protein